MERARGLMHVGLLSCLCALSSEEAAIASSHPNPSGAPQTANGATAICQEINAAVKIAAGTATAASTLGCSRLAPGPAFACSV